jgi:hypothetical protein
MDKNVDKNIHSWLLKWVTRKETTTNALIPVKDLN